MSSLIVHSFVGVIKSGGLYFNIISSDFSVSSSGIERSNGIRTFVAPTISKWLRYCGFNVLDYQTIAVVSNGQVLRRIFDEVRVFHIYIHVCILFLLL